MSADEVPDVHGVFFRVDRGKFTTVFMADCSSSPPVGLRLMGDSEEAATFGPVEPFDIIAIPVTCRLMFSIDDNICSCTNILGVNLTLEGQGAPSGIYSLIIFR